jgi:protein-L-isoaspartate O-methyltransferase
VATTSSSSPAVPPILPFAGRVYGMDIHPDLVELSTRNIRKVDGDLLLINNDDDDNKKSSIISLKVGNGWHGWPEQAPFDAIHVGAAASTFPLVLAQQLRQHGVLIVPIGPTSGVQTLLRVERINTTGTFRFDFTLTELLGVRYVPLVQGPDS